MPARGAHTRRVAPMGLCDAFDGTASFQGAMAQLGNLIPQPNARGVVVPRPAMTFVANLPDYGGGPVTALEEVGDTFYGMVASAQFPGRDTPFVYDPDGSGFIAISGLFATALPLSQPTIGDWTPPTIARVGGRVIFTHPGFSGGKTNPTTATVFLATMTSGLPTLLAGVSPGWSIPAGARLYGSGIPGGTTVTRAAQVKVYTTATGTAGASTFVVASATGIALGMHASALGLYAAVTNIAGTTITVNVPLGSNLAGDSVIFTGVRISMTQQATLTQSVRVALASSVADKFGWIDISGFTTAITGNTSTTDSPIITGNFDVTGIEPGMTISGPNLTGGKGVIWQARNVNFVAVCALTTGSTIIDLEHTLTLGPIAVGMTVSGTGIPADTTVTQYATSTQTIAISQAATVTNAVVPVTFSGSILIIDHATTGAADNQAYSIAGGTPATPLWYVGDLNILPIGSDEPPVFVAQYGGRAYYGVNTPTTAGVQASDAGSATTQTFESQTLLFEGAVPVTAAAGLPLETTAGGIIQALLVFQGDTAIQQITGDFSTAIGVNALQIATGTRSPNSIAATPRGLLFAGTDGLRLVNFYAVVSDPLGEHGHGVVLPFINAVTPSRTNACFNENVYRVTVTWQPPVPVQSVWGAAPRIDEFWFHFPPHGRPIEEGRWSGPHTSIMDLSAAWPSKSSFLAAPQGGRGAFYRSDPKPAATSVYVEFSQQLATIYETLLLPDDSDGFVRRAVQTTIWSGLLTGSEEILVTATDDFGQQLDQTYVWISAVSLPAFRAIAWHVPLLYRQMRVRIDAGATPNLQLGMLAIREKQLGYQLPYPVPQEFILNQDALGGFTVLGA